MKILAATTTFKPDLCEAISKNLVHLYKAVSEKDAVTLLIPGALPLGYGPNETPFNIKSYSNYNPYGSLKALLINIRRLMMAIQTMDTSDYDLIHLHVGFCIELFFLKRVVRKMSLPLVVTIWQPYLNAKELASLFRLGRWKLMRDMLPHILMNSFLLRPLYGYGAKGYRRILVSSQTQRNQLSKFVSRDRVEQAFNGVKKKDGMSSNHHQCDNRLLYIGHNTPTKGVHMILKALAQLSGRAAFTMTFAFSDRGNLKSFWTLVRKYGLEENITVKGTVCVEEEMNRHDLFLIPYQTSVGVSYYPNVVLECIAAGLPLISTKIPVMYELLEPIESNLLVPMNDDSALANRVLQFFNEPERLLSVRHRLLECAIPYDFDTSVEQYRHVCNGVLEDMQN